MVLKEHTSHIALLSILAWKSKPTGMAEYLAHGVALQKPSFEEKLGFKLHAALMGSRSEEL